MARPFAAPPGVPADRVAALRNAFQQMLKDPEFLAETQKLRLDVHPMDGPTMEKLLKEIYATPKNVLAQAAQAVAK
jgi:tripartite-type tricarboxylate transporter receptor subunit TctC